ncbi:MAG: hypothetical protein ACK5C0_00485 [Candidatus Kapaibacterium sp.]|jgi:hypothetical protein
MNNEYPNPWNFSNIDKNLISPNGHYSVEFGELNEIAMGAPIGGECYLNFDNLKYKLNEWCAGPIIWNNLSTKIALPIWTKNRNQKIEIVDISEMKITTYKREFRVLQFHSFVHNLLQGIDSPIYMTRTLYFDVDKEEIEKTKKLNE